MKMKRDNKTKSYIKSLYKGEGQNFKAFYDKLNVYILCNDRMENIIIKLEKEGIQISQNQLENIIKTV